MVRHSLVFAALMIVCSGCASAPGYEQILQEDNSYNQKSFDVAGNDLYLATLKTLYAKSFMIEKADETENLIIAKRSFQEKKRTIILIIQAKIVEDTHGESSTIFMSGLETTERTYVADRTRFLLFVIPLPGGGGKQVSTIKEGEKVITDQVFYTNFINAIEKTLETSSK